MAKVLGPVIGYGSDYELSQFVYDLWLWSSVGSAKNSANIPLRCALAGRSFSPEFWKTRHAALIDMQHQLGYPTLFITVAPYEWSFPYADWIEHELQETFRSRLYLPAAETYHIAHVLTQAIVGLVAGANQESTLRDNRCWRKHVLGPKDGSDKTAVINFFARLEFQDGKRKKVTLNRQQFYHGRGTVHVHCLLWLQNTASIDLPGVVKAQVPSTNAALRNIVLASQQSYSGSGWPVRNTGSVWDDDLKLLYLEHAHEDARRGIRIDNMISCIGVCFVKMCQMYAYYQAFAHSWRTSLEH